ncbi:hypothetical protein OSB04_005592 [Centaurea solstitialis]|uniref:F-box domain-containing protein n=1 Tax=Centaurea solstitialis TaxID=347529 RepID=A0AA38WGY5_9ASTR|nr:hypothetical protein OSB04_005592 [Centaurea solstitialis]
MPCTSKSNRGTRNWLDLPSDVTANILSRLGLFDILEIAQKVCNAWCEICKDPVLWRVIHVDYKNLSLKAETFYKQAVDNSQGQLIDITIENYSDDEFLQYVAARSRQLRHLRVASCYGFSCMGGTWIEALKKFPVLAELSLYSAEVSKEFIETAGHYCPMLKTLKLNHGPCPFFEESVEDCDNIAIAIGENLHKLEHLELIGSCMSNIGLGAILDGCDRLKSLDLRGCVNIDLKGAVGKRCLEQIKCVKLPNESLEGCPYIYIIDRDAYSEDSDDHYFDHDDADDEDFFDHDAEYDNFMEHDDEYDEFDGYFRELLTSMDMFE